MSTNSFVIELANHKMLTVPPPLGHSALATAKLYTTLPDQERVELVVWEDAPSGSSPRSFVGVAVIPLPSRLPAHTPLKVTFEERGSEVVVSVSAGSQQGSAQTATLRRRRWETSRLAHLLQACGKLNALLAQWGDELTTAERRQAEELRGDIEAALAGTTLSDSDTDQLSYEAETAAYQLGVIRARDALLAAVLAYGRKYLTPAQDQRLHQLQSALSAARARNDRLRTMALIEENEGELDALGGPLLLLVHARAALESRRLPQASAVPLDAAVREVEQGVSRKQDQQVRHGLTQLMYMFEGVVTTLQQQQVVVSRRPIDIVP